MYAICSEIRSMMPRLDQPSLQNAMLLHYTRTLVVLYFVTAQYDEAENMLETIRDIRNPSYYELHYQLLYCQFGDIFKMAQRYQTAIGLYETQL